VIDKFFGDGEDEGEIQEESEGKLSKIKDKIFGKAKDETEAEEDETPEEVTLDEPPVEFNTNQVKESAATSLFGLKKPAKKKDEHVIAASHIKIDLPFDLLSDKIGKATGGDIKNNMMVIQRTLENFGIPVEMGEISVGPTVTQYTFKPAEGIKLSRITTLGNDLALSLAAHPLRIEAPIPGRSLVGVEVPNQTKAVVGLREVLSSKAFKERPSNLMIALGKDVAGNAWLYDIAKMPHLLVAGATGSGKSVCLNTIIISLLYQNNPDDLKFIMVDPKRVELPAYNGIPHLLTPVITDVNKTINALKWCLNEMDRRFETLSKSGKRNIESYNQNSKERMPYIVFIIDELADLMIASPRDIESAIIRLAQMARAVGIHLILATQRPSVDVITGLIKANMPARIAFSVASGVDSRTILDSLGAEKLLGRGDMLFITAELSKPKRIQGTFVSDLEIRKITNYIKEKAGAPNYVENITERQKVSGIAGAGLNPEGSGDDDELLDEAREMIISSGKASASVLQRRLSIGYARAARILDLLEEAGVIGPVNGSKPREILISKDDYAMMKAVREEEGEEEVESSSSYKVESEKEEKEEESQSSNIKFQNEEEELREVEERDMHEEDNEEKANKEYEDDEDDGKYFSR
jgi:S-DNA-T family DNA segregation ATPase FtsK/SpoIIIE